MPPGSTYFDLAHSGAILAWQFFYGQQPPPTFLYYVEERDLWSWRTEEAKAFAAYVDQVPMRSEEYEKFADETTLRRVVQEGQLMLRLQNSVVEQVCASAVQRRFRGYRVYVVNATLFVTEIGNALSLRSDCDFSVCWSYSHRDQCIFVSLRAATEAIDLSALAKQFGGGGHVKASGFRLPYADIERLFDSDTAATK